MPEPSPLARFFLQLAERRDRLRRLGRGALEPSEDDDEPISAAEFLHDLHAGAADLQVWLEMQGRSDEASEIDDATASLRETIWEFDRGELEPHPGPDERDDVVGGVDQLIDAIDRAIGRLEGLDGDLPDEVWRGYDDV